MKYYIVKHPHAEKKYLLDVIPEFFARDAEQGPRNCSCAAGRIDFLHAPLFATHGDVRPALPTLQCTVALSICGQRLEAVSDPCSILLELQTANLASCRPVAQQSSSMCPTANATLVLTPALLLQALEAYVKQADPKRKLIILSYVGVWTKVQARRLPLASMTVSCMPVTLAGLLPTAVWHNMVGVSWSRRQCCRELVSQDAPQYAFDSRQRLCHATCSASCGHCCLLQL